MNLIDARFSALLPQRAAGKDLVLAVLRAARGGDAAAPRQSQPAAMPAWDDTRPVVFRSEAFAEDLLELA
jgi:hypothetical protein